MKTAKQERERIVALIDLWRWSQADASVSIGLKGLIVNAINGHDEEYIRYLGASRAAQMGGNWTYNWDKKAAAAMCPDLPCNSNKDNGSSGDDSKESTKRPFVGPRGRYGGMRSRRSGHMGYSPSCHPMS